MSPLRVPSITMAAAGRERSMRAAGEGAAPCMTTEQFLVIALLVIAAALLNAPALMRIPDCKTVEWKDLPAEQLPAAFSECVPVCWSFHMTEAFLRKFPERAVVRPWRH
jgi:hypothetical protein